MIKKIYHGSNRVIECPEYGYGKPHNDYGLGFYCTEDKDMAREWGVSADRDGTCNAYEIELDGLTVLNLNTAEFCILHWLNILLQNRTFEISSPLASEAKDYLLKNFSVDYERADVIIGYRADDSYFAFAQDFINGAISYRQLERAMHLGNLGEQIVIKSERAFERLTFRGADIALRTDWLSKKEKRDSEARRDYLNVERNRRQAGDIYITHIIDEEMKADDSRLR